MFGQFCTHHLWFLYDLVYLTVGFVLLAGILRFSQVSIRKVAPSPRCDYFGWFRSPFGLSFAWAVVRMASSVRQPRSFLNPTGSNWAIMRSSSDTGHCASRTKVFIRKSGAFGPYTSPSRQLPSLSLCSSSKTRIRTGTMDGFRFTRLFSSG